MTPYYQDKWVTIYCKSSGNMLELEDNSVDEILTDPPYNVGKDYGNGVQADKRPDYLEWLSKIWIEAARTAKDGSFLIYTNTTTFIPYGMNPPAPWRYFHLACWNKPLSLRPAFYGICPHWEPIFICLKGDKPWRPFRGKEIFPDVFNANVVYDKTGNRQHPTPKPVGLYEKLALFGCPARGLILDPFGGTGTTAVAAKKLGYRCVIYEDKEKYCEIAAKRCSQSVMEM